MMLDGGPITIAADELPRFADEICPALRSVAPIVSSDGSFTPPEVSAPSLALRARFGDGHAAELAWAWAYRVGNDTRYTPLGIDDAVGGCRDREAERSILAKTRLGASGLERFGLLDAAGRPAEASAAVLAGVDTMHLATECLPRLRELHGVHVEVEGEPADYRDVAHTLQIGVATADLADDRDWFDLGVTRMRTADRKAA